MEWAGQPTLIIYMKIKRTYKTLINGVLWSWFLGLLALFHQAVVTQDYPVSMWLLLAAEILILFHNYELDKVVDENILAQHEQLFLIANFITVVFMLGVFWITFSRYWLADEIRYVSLIAGLSSLISIIYWFTLKRV